MKVAFYSGIKKGIPGLYNRAVKLIDKGEYSHCELVFSDGVSASASFMDKGVRFKEINYNTPDWTVIEIEGYDEVKAREFFEKYNGYRYDVLGNLRFLLGFIKESKNKFFCSEVIMGALGYDEPWRFGPNGVYSLLKKGL